MTCSVDGCTKPIRCKSLCKAHHLRQWRYGDPLGGGPSRGHARQFMLDHVSHQGDECVLWPFSKNDKGYGDVRFKGLEGMLVHRVMCTLAHGAAPEPLLDTAHSCGVRACINPRHLSWKTRVDNHADKQKHGTQIWGDQVHFAKLTPAQARIAKYDGRSATLLASAFGVSIGCINSIRAGRTWKGL